MNKKSTLIYSLYLAVSLHMSVAVMAVGATKLTAPALPHDVPHDDKDHDFTNGSQECIIPESATRFKRRPDDRELRKQRADDAVEAAKKAEEDKKAAAQAGVKAQQDRVAAYQQQLKVSIDANNEAVNLGKQGRWLEAIDAHEKAVQYDPRNKQFKVNLSAARTAYGQQRMAAKDYTTAATYFRKALLAASDNALAGKLLVDAMKKSGLDPGLADTRLNVGDQLAAAGDTAGASIEYQAAMQLDPSAKTYVKMGDLAYRYGQAAQAAGYYHQAIVKDRDYAPAYRQMGLLQLASRDTTTAASSLRQALICDPNDVAASQCLTDIWRKQVSNNPNVSENHLGLAGALQLSGDFQGADTEYKKVEAMEPNNPALAAGKASLTRAINHAKAEKYKMAFTTLYNQGLHKEALAEISQAVSLEPKNANYMYLLGECFEAAGDYSRAHQAYLNCVLIDPENNKEAASRMKQMEGMAQQQQRQAPPLPQQPAAQQQAPASMQPQSAPQGQYRAGQLGTQQQYYRPAAQFSGTPAQPAPINQSNPSNNNLSRNEIPGRKNQFEGGSGSTTPAQGMNFRTHDESENAALAQPAATTSDAAAPAAQKPVDSITRLNMAETQRDYATAITILQGMVSDNLQNPDMHHRLAVDLMSAGQMSEAISEFRIASALNPTQKTYADDLARAMAIHKKSLSSEGSGVPQ